MKLEHIAATAAVGCLLAGMSVLYIKPVAAADQVKEEDVIGGGAPAKVLTDNASMRVTLVSYPKDFYKDGGLRRKNEQILVYVDDGQFKVNRPPGSAPNPAKRPERGPESPIAPDGSVASGVHPQGTVTWHPKGSLTPAPSLTTQNAYRVLFIELKR